jgi:hypothetical protein
MMPVCYVKKCHKLPLQDLRISGRGTISLCKFHYEMAENLIYQHNREVMDQGYKLTRVVFNLSTEEGADG